jgi:hypothetical protein
MTSIFGALLTAGYSSAMGAALAGSSVTENTQAQLQLSFASAENVAAQNPAQASQISAAAESSFLKGDQWAYLAAMAAVLIGMALVFRFFPRKDEEEALRATYHADDARREAAVAEPEVPVSAPGPAQAG